MSRRSRRATGGLSRARVVRVSPETARAVAAGDAPKGDVLGTARIAGIQAAKRTSELIPLCHPLALSFVGVEGSVDADGGEIVLTAEARTTGPTGVEMEALTAVAVAALTVLRHGQGAGARRRDRGGRPAREVGWPVGNLAQGSSPGVRSLIVGAWALCGQGTWAAARLSLPRRSSGSSWWRAISAGAAASSRLNAR